MNHDCLNWAVEHAPVASPLERAVLVAMTRTANPEGEGACGDLDRLSRIACADREDVISAVAEMREGGLLRRSPESGAWEVMVPASYWGASRLEEVNTRRSAYGVPPITARNRPDIPPRATRQPEPGEPPSPGFGAWVLLSGIPHGAKVLYLILAAAGAPGHPVAITQKKLAGLLGLKKTEQVKRYTDALVAIGAVEVEHAFSKRGLRDENSYIVHAEAPPGHAGPTSVRDKTDHGEEVQR